MTKPLILAASVTLAALLAFLPGPSFAGIGLLGACCQTTNGCCPPFGECRIATEVGCGGQFEQYMGDGTDCIEICAPTTTTTIAQGACCEPGGACLDVTQNNCVIGDYQGDGTECATVECPQPTTTTTPETTTTTVAPETTTTTVHPPTTTVPDTTTTTEPPVVLCGDANADGAVSSVDALIALRTSVGTSQCPETRCDYNGNGDVQSSDALAILRVSVGQSVVPMCPVH